MTTIVFIEKQTHAEKEKGRGGNSRYREYHHIFGRWIRNELTGQKLNPESLQKGYQSEDGPLTPEHPRKGWDLEALGPERGKNEAPC